MNLVNLFAAALVASLAWYLGHALVQTVVNYLNLRINRRADRLGREKRIAAAKASTATAKPSPAPFLQPTNTRLN